MLKNFQLKICRKNETIDLSKAINITKTFNKASFNRKLYVFIICLTLASFFWLLNALRNNFVAEIDLDIEYHNFPTQKIALNKLSNHVTAKVKGLGFDLLAYKLRLKKEPLIIDLSRLKITNQIAEARLGINSYRSMISNQIGSVDVLEIYPESLSFVLDDKIEKVLEITPQTQLTFKEKYQLSGDIKTIPSTVTVVGPKSLLDTLHVYTERIKLNDLDEDVNQMIGLATENKNELVEYAIQEVELYIPVEEYVESFIKTIIESINSPQDSIITITPNQVEVHFMSPLSIASNTDSTEFKVVADYTQQKEGGSQLMVSLSKHPKYIHLISINPKRVDYTIEKRKK